jgi:hypothetical protein
LARLLFGFYLHATVRIVFLHNVSELADGLLIGEAIYLVVLERVGQG